MLLKPATEQTTEQTERIEQLETTQEKHTRWLNAPFTGTPYDPDSEED